MGLGLGGTTTGLLGLERRQMMRSRKLVGFLDEDEEGRGFQSVEMVSQQSRVSGWKVLVDLFYVLSYGSLARTIPLLQSSDCCVDHLIVRRVFGTEGDGHGGDRETERERKEIPNLGNRERLGHLIFILGIVSDIIMMSALDFLLRIAMPFPNQAVFILSKTF